MTTLKIAGGIYREICLFPERREILGSGGRAAAALSASNSDIELHGFCPSGPLANEIRLNLALYGVPIVLHDSSALISFRWLHGLASPQQEPAVAPGDPQLEFVLDGEVVLRYGMVEGTARVDAQIAVYDPQAPLRATPFWKNGSQAKKLAYVINSAEAKLLTNVEDEREQLRSIHEIERASVVVLKQGPHGAIVSDGQRMTRVPCFKTENVWPIGSGDVFSAFFAQKWAIEGLRADDAAYQASLATAFYCNAGYLPVPPDFAAMFAPLPCKPTTSDGRPRQVYLAGPFFSVSQRWLIDSLRETFQKLNVKVFSPIHDVGEGKAEYVAKEDLAGIETSDVIFAVCDGLDAGTLFEIGYAVSKGKPVVAFTQLEKSEDLTMLSGTGCLIERDLDTAIYKAVWKAIEK